MASIVTFLVALPLSMGIALASGVPVAAGLISAIIGGLIVGLLSGSPLQVSGPAAGLTVIVYDIVQRHGLPVLGVAVALAGLLQIIAGVLHLGQWFRAVSPAVVKGMLSGIGVLIMASQFHVLVDDSPKASGIQNLVSIPEAVIKGLPLPRMGTEAERQFRAEKLKQIGVLHEHQGEIEETVSEWAADETRDVPWETWKADLESSAARQADQSARLEVFINELSAMEPSSTKASQDRQSLLSVSQAALRASQEAESALQQGPPSKLRQSQHSAVAALDQVLRQLKSHDWAAKIGLLTIVVLLAWQSFAPRSIKIIPSPLVAVAVATGLASWLYLPVLYVEIPDRLLDGVHLPSWAVIHGMGWIPWIEAALVIAIVASAETLLCASAVDQLHSGPRTRYDRELMAQGVGNTLCGIVGALPMTGVIVRSAANVQAGAKTRLSAMLHGLWMLILVALFPAVLTMIPTAALAAILVYTGYKLIRPRTFIELWKHGKGEAVIWLVTVSVIVFEDLLTGVIVGIVLSAGRLFLFFTALRVTLDVDAEEDSATLLMRGAATFVRLPRLAEALESVPSGSALSIDCSHLWFIDHACWDLLENFEKQHKATGGQVSIDWGSLRETFRRRRPGLALSARAAYSLPEEPLDGDSLPSRDEANVMR